MGSTDCLIWDGYTKNGYGIKTVNGHQVYVHRAVMAEAVGWEAIDGKVVRHSCDEPRCYSLDHLLIGTQADNLRDMTERGRRRSRAEWDRCVHGHPYDEANTYWRKDRPGHRECRTCRKGVIRHR